MGAREARRATSRRAAERPPTTLVGFLHDKWLTIIVHVASLAPLAALAWRYKQDDLGVDVVNTLYNWTGRSSILLLLLSLACAPIEAVFGFRKVLTVRRALGLYAFLYAVLHFANFLYMDYALDIPLILRDAILTKPYIIVGLAALLLLVPLALTSTRGWMRRLGRAWKRLHRVVYLVGALAALHFFWQAKAAERFDPLLYGTLLTLLLVVRIPPVRRRIVQTRYALTKNWTGSTQLPTNADRINE